ncbi:putative Blasticidin-S acetyltransferase [Streptomyces ambofaciens ATCC 23877]|uniref:Putative Blasticidin-S acetyltransferase n=1 Tax=Streptomyces ambofaciens (strain ATCC 23877 / 3486 / DSM 40053 / JCM 4204 / NBRC 12836 / NRRL B-2516) TaxID=278992 RepID=A0A0K2APW8_STRA7|nr:GNAT family N-acetyltransferase [Streptomyces ambofaciens]AKZ55155.1 putative Blasticidin-S acetyltransferase [Streptomyces ambofaciens ATCC 23877]
MTSEQHTATTAALHVGGADDDLEQRLDAELTAYNTAAAQGARTRPLTVRVTDDEGALVGGLTARTWGTLASVDMLWVREDQRQAGWGSRLMRAAEEEAARRGCTDVIVSTYTFQAPGFYPRLGYRERGRIEGVPGGHEDVYFHKRVGTAPDRTGRVLGA